MDINDLTLRQARTLAQMFAADPQTSNFWQIGKPYLIRTVTMIDTGTLDAVTDHEIILRDAAWIADTGRFSTALESCEFQEIEPFPAGLVAIGRGSIIEAVQITKAPRAIK